MSADMIMTKLLMLPGIILGLSFHEFAHAWVSDKLGDPTPRRQGRVTINPLAHIEIQGHTSSEGGDAFNQTLSEQRAYTVFLYMTEKGVDRGRLSASGYGSSQPRASNATEEGRRKNRRIELRVLNEDEVQVEHK